MSPFKQHLLNYQAEELMYHTIAYMDLDIYPSFIHNLETTVATYTCIYTTTMYQVQTSVKSAPKLKHYWTLFLPL